MPNGLGIYDMSGNVSEWCIDIYDEKAYMDLASEKNPLSIGGSNSYVNRGGSWFDQSYFIRVTNRNGSRPDIRFPTLGFRLVYVP